jgi:hypothetical protein
VQKRCGTRINAKNQQQKRTIFSLVKEFNDSVGKKETDERVSLSF